MGFSFYSYLILLSVGSDASIEGLKVKMESFYAKDRRNVRIQLEGNNITLAIDGYHLYVCFSDEDHVLVESKEIADDTAKDFPQYETISNCPARFEMSSDPDPNMDYFNYNIFLQEMMEEFCGVFVFDPAEGSFMNS